MSYAEEFLLFIFNKFFLPSMWEKVGGGDQKADSSGNQLLVDFLGLFLFHSLFH